MPSISTTREAKENYFNERKCIPSEELCHFGKFEKRCGTGEMWVVSAVLPEYENWLTKPSLFSRSSPVLLIQRHGTLDPQTHRHIDTQRYSDTQTYT